jgi:hypothetical protein
MKDFNLYDYLAFKIADTKFTVYIVGFFIIILVFFAFLSFVWQWFLLNF